MTDLPWLMESDDGSGDIDNLQRPTKLDNSDDVFEYIEESGQQDADDGDGDDGNKDSGMSRNFFEACKNNALKKSHETFVL